MFLSKLFKHIHSNFCINTGDNLLSSIFQIIIYLSNEEEINYIVLLNETKLDILSLK